MLYLSNPIVSAVQGLEPIGSLHLLSDLSYPLSHVNKWIGEDLNLGTFSHKVYGSVVFFIFVTPCYWCRLIYRPFKKALSVVGGTRMLRGNGIFTLQKKITHFSLSIGMFLIFHFPLSIQKENYHCIQLTKSSLKMEKFIYQMNFWVEIHVY